MKNLVISLSAIIVLSTGNVLLADDNKTVQSAKPSVAAKGDLNLLKRKSVEENIVTRLQQANSEMQYTDVRPSPIAGLYQVQVVGGPLLYVTEAGDKFIAGELYDVQAHGFAKYEDPVVVAERKKLFTSLNPKDAIIFKPSGKTKAVVYVFTDVDCGYCRKLNSEMVAYNENGKQKPGYNDLGIEVRYLAFPRAGVPSGSAEKLVTAWCSADKQKALTLLKKDVNVPAAKCTNPVAAQYALGVKVGVNGTPAIWMPNGELKPGYLPPEQLAKELGI